MARSFTSKGIGLSLVSLLIVLVQTFGHTPSHADSCVLPDSPLEELRESYAVFKGKVVSKQYHQSGKSTGYSGATSKFQVESVWKGQVSQTAFVFPGGWFTEGVSYVIYADRSFGDDTFTFGQCSRTALGYDVEEDIAVLGEGYAPKPDAVSPSPFPTVEPVPTKNWSNPASDLPKEEGSGGCGLPKDTIQLSFVGLIVGLAWFALRRRRS